MKNNNDSLIADLENELNKKSFEELIYIYYNQEHFVSNFTQAGRMKNQELLIEVKRLNDDYEKKKMKYDNLKSEAEKLLHQFETKEQELKSGFKSNIDLNQSYSLDNLIKDLENYIQTNFKTPKEQLIKEFMNKTITQKDFESKFKKLSYDYHYYSIILEKLHLFKRQQ